MAKYVLYNTQDDEIYYYIQANSIRSAAKQAKDKHPSYAVAPYALTSISEANCGKVDWQSWQDTHNWQPEIYKLRGNYGGYRPNAGRKKELPEGAKPYSFKLTKDEQAQVREFIKQLRSK